MKIFISILALFLFINCGDNETSELDFLIGTWKRENKEQFEVWEKKNDIELNGYSYRTKDNQKTITETLVIKKINDQFVYEATVPDQNEGRTVQFILNTETDSLFSFENDKHDFPKKIQYKKINDNQLKVIVLGDDNAGFSYIQIKQ
ncbi:MAG: hypothetical protein HKO81_07280 [Flavobacteriaceae bacterium]|nr:hypothetical protein [Flavobacteriaceae bacterium]